MDKRMTHGSLFSGIGGFDLAAQWMEWDNIFHCEIDPFGRKILNHYWPNCISYGDIKTTDFSIHKGAIDIITGGFPCQPYSTAGKRLGKEDERHLWPEMLRAIRQIQPRWVVGENVRGLINWNGGMVFDEVQADLEAEGYEVLPFLLPACAVNAPHRRNRIWFIANSSNARVKDLRREWKNTIRESESTPNPNSQGLQRGKIDRGISSIRQNRDEQFSRFISSTWENFPTQSPICSRNDGLPRRLDGITFSKWKNESIKSAGNAIVPQVVLQIFKAIQQYESTRTI